MHLILARPAPLRMLWPHTSASPADAGSTPASMAIVLLFPAPLAPSRQKHSPVYNIREMHVRQGGTGKKVVYTVGHPL